MGVDGDVHRASAGHASNSSVVTATDGVDGGSRVVQRRLTVDLLPTAKLGAFCLGKRSACFPIHSIAVVSNFILYLVTPISQFRRIIIPFYF